MMKFTGSKSSALPHSVEIWYLAHPVKSDKVMSFEKNLDHTLTLQKKLLTLGIVTVAPWFSWCEAYGDTQEDNPEIMSQMLQMDLEVARACGRIVLTGHKLSNGMSAELKLILSMGGEVLNLIGIPDDDIPMFVRGS